MKVNDQLFEEIFKMMEEKADKDLISFVDGKETLPLADAEYAKYYANNGALDVVNQQELPSNEELLSNAVKKNSKRRIQPNGRKLTKVDTYAAGTPTGDHRYGGNVDNMLGFLDSAIAVFNFEDPELSAAAVADLKKLADKVDINRMAVIRKMYQDAQKMRIRIANQILALSGKSPSIKIKLTPDIPNYLEYYFWIRALKTERYLEMILELMVQRTPQWQWLKHIVGIGPKLAAHIVSVFTIDEGGQEYYIDEVDADGNPILDDEGNVKKKKMYKKPFGKTSGSWERFGGIDPTQKKAEKGEKRTYSSEAKTLLFNISDCFIKGATKGRGEGSLYVKMYRQYYKEEWDKNERGENAEYCAARLAAKKGAPGEDTTAYKCYVVGKIPPKQVEMRARRKVEKLFLNHYHTVYNGLVLHKQPPIPFVIAHLFHVHEIEVPCWDKEHLCVRPPRFGEEEPDWFALPNVKERLAALNTIAKEKAALKKQLGRSLTPEEEKEFTTKKNAICKLFPISL